MNTTQIIINSILTLLLPVLIGYACWVYRLAVQRLPEQQAARVEQFARMAVRKVEQQYTNNPNKKALAEAYIAKMFEAFHIPMPSKEAIDTAIESAVFEINKVNK